MTRFVFKFTDIAGQNITIKVVNKTQNKAQKLAQQLRGKIITNPDVVARLSTCNFALVPTVHGAAKQLYADEYEAIQEWCQIKLKRNLSVTRSETEKLIFVLF